jgi:hypothetical protein
MAAVPIAIEPPLPERASSGETSSELEAETL